MILLDNATHSSLTDDPQSFDPQSGHILSLVNTTIILTITNAATVLTLCDRDSVSGLHCSGAVLPQGGHPMGQCLQF